MTVERNDVVVADSGVAGLSGAVCAARADLDPVVPEGTHVEHGADGHVATREETATTVHGDFAAGDVVDPRYRRAVTTAGTGSRAALGAETWLEARAARAAPAAVR